MILLNFILALFYGLLVVRAGAWAFHDFESYDENHPERSKSQTITGWLRRKTHFDWHHYHFGIILLLISIVWIFLSGTNNINVISLGLGLSWFVDQMIPIEGCYFSKKKLIASIIAHIIIALIAIMIFYI